MNPSALQIKAGGGGRQRVAIVGSGISGMVSAWMLHPEHEIVVYEAADRIGGHTHTHAIETENGTQWIDSGFIVLNDKAYPNFNRILERIGVEIQPSHMAFSVSGGDRDADGRASGNGEWATNNLNGLFASRSNLTNPRFYRMLREIPRFYKELRHLIGANGTAPPLKDFLADGGYSEDFIQNLIVPQVSAVWSADPAQMDTFPASFLAEFFENHGALQLVNRPRWQTIKGGSIRYIEQITRPFADKIRLNDGVISIKRDEGGVEITSVQSGVERFDQVVIASHSDQALAMLADPTPAEREVLGQIHFQPNEAVLHTDASVMPRHHRAWSSWNYHRPAPGPAEGGPGKTTVTYWMNRLQRHIESDQDYFVTLNQTEAIDPDAIIKVMEYAHPVFTQDAVAAQRRWSEISGRHGTHYAGAYWSWGFHEDGVDSALRVCREGFAKVLA